MSSSIFYRFKSQKDPQPITFDGTSLSVFEVKREVIALSKLGDGADFDLEIYTPESSEKYDDDTTQIPRSTTVIARRLPASKPGAGRAARYVTGKMPVNAKNQHRIESTPATTSARETPAASAMGSGKEMTEEEKLAAMFDANTEAWKHDQSLMVGKPAVRPPYNSSKNAPVPDKPLPPGYICHRCGEKGHWIQACPTNADPNFDGRPKFRRTTGIPKSFLKVIEKTERDENGKVDMSKMPAGVMYNAAGEWVVSMPDTKTWEKIQEQNAASKEKAKEASDEGEELKKVGLACSIDGRGFVDPVKTPCCGRTYCRECIENTVLDNDLQCPNCGEQVLLDNLEADEEALKKLKEFEEEKKARKETKKEASKSPEAGSPGKAKGSTPKPEDARSPSADKGQETKVDGTTSSHSTPNSKKRAATDELENTRKPANPAPANNAGKRGTPTPIPTGPKAQQQQQQQQQQMPNMMKPANNMQDFAQQMNAMASGVPGMQGGMPGMANPMMNPMMMGMNPMMMGMPGFNPMMGMNGMGGGMNGMGMGGMGGGMGNGGWQGPQQGGWGNGGGGFGAGGQQDGGAYFRQPVNPHRQQGRGRGRQRSVDYKQM
ncbi:DWNN-domain-containing protein [Hortaea werneckii]|nr:DWNN-domain-containing protein [Hortaea werneckii]KAI7485030.1 DWNN-domain-containing protein [Hortaea werneckii]